MSIKWNKLTDHPPTGEGPYLYFPVYACAGHSINTTSGAYLRGPYVGKPEEVYWAEFNMPPGFDEFEAKRDEWDNEDAYVGLTAVEGVVSIPGVCDNDGNMSDDIFEILENVTKKEGDTFPDGTPEK